MEPLVWEALGQATAEIWKNYGKHVTDEEKLMMGTNHIINDVVDHQLPVIVNVAENTSSDDDINTDEEDLGCQPLRLTVINCEVFVHWRNIYKNQLFCGMAMVLIFLAFLFFHTYHLQYWSLQYLVACRLPRIGDELSGEHYTCSSNANCTKLQMQNACILSGNPSQK